MVFRNAYQGKHIRKMDEHVIGAPGGVPRNASEDRVQFLAAMRNRALEPLWQNASALFQARTSQSCSFFPPYCAIAFYLTWAIVMCAVAAWQ